MDFHSLARRELQSLCKKNKIPANITNAGMADALKALEIVEGLEEFLSQLESNPSQNFEESALRTMTRRKPTANAAPQNLARPIRSARKLVTEVLSEENKDGNVPSTPAVPTGRKKAPTGSTRRKVETQTEEATVQHAYSTRRSVRLLEKGMDQLSLNEKGRVEAVKMDTLDNVEEKKDDNTEAKHDDEQENDMVKTEVADQAFVPLDVKGKTYDEETFVSNDVSSEISDNITEENDAIIIEKVADDVNKDSEVVKLDLNVDVEQETEGSPAQVFDTESTLKPEVDNLICQEELVDANNPTETSEKDCQNLEITRDAEIVLAEDELADVKDDALIENPSEDESNNEKDTEVMEEVNHVNEGLQLEFSAEKARDVKDESSDSDIDDETESDQEDIHSEGHLDTNIKQSEDRSDGMETEAEASEEGNKIEDDEHMDKTVIGSATATGNSAAGKTVVVPKCSSNKKQMIPVSELNKENIDNAAPKKAEMKKNTDLSLRQLSKMVKQKLIITNKAKNVDYKNVCKDPVGKTRVALEKLSENHMSCLPQEDH